MIFYICNVNSDFFSFYLSSHERLHYYLFLCTKHFVCLQEIKTIIIMNILFIKCEQLNIEAHAITNWIKTNISIKHVFRFPSNLCDEKNWELRIKKMERNKKNLINSIGVLSNLHMNNNNNLHMFVRFTHHTLTSN